MKKRILSLLLTTTILFSCSVVKNPSATSNFKRVKYNSHLKLANNNLSKPIRAKESPTEILRAVPVSLDEQKKHIGMPLLEPIESIDATKILASKDLKARLLKSQLFSVDQKVKEMSLQLNKQENDLSTLDAWWESDPEDWPLEQIILAAIAVLLLLLAIYLLIEILGAVVGSILGLVILLLLAYFVLQYMT